MGCNVYKQILAFVGLLGFVTALGFVGDTCTVESSGLSGTCQLYKQCISAVEELEKYSRFPQTCGFQGRQPIVCCPKPQRKPGEISIKKCREYAEYVYETKPAPTLLINVSPIRRNECGQKVVKLIIGGEPAGRKEFPHMVAIGYEEASGNICWGCGGSILSDRYILTAAHCLHSALGDLTATHVRMGAIDLNNTRESHIIKIAERIAYPEYKYPSTYHDVGLIKLEKPARLNPNARPACLYAKDRITAERAIATGWGDTTLEGFSQSNRLMKVLLHFVDNDYCNQTFKGVSQRRLRSGILENVQICAGSDSDDPKDTCQGDSGGPLQIFHAGDDIKCMYDIVGITSFGKQCGSQPAVYVRVSNYVKWIEDIVWPEES